MDDPADIWTIDTLNTLSDRPGMDSQKTDTIGYKYFKKFDQFELQSFTSTTNTFVVFSYDADWEILNPMLLILTTIFQRPCEIGNHLIKSLGWFLIQIICPSVGYWVQHFYRSMKQMIGKMMEYMETPLIHLGRMKA